MEVMEVVFSLPNKNKQTFHTKNFAIVLRIDKIPRCVVSRALTEYLDAVTVYYSLPLCMWQ